MLASYLNLLVISQWFYMDSGLGTHLSKTVQSTINKNFDNLQYVVYRSHVKHS